MKTRTTKFAAMAAACFVGSAAYAGTTVVPQKKGPPIDDTSESCISGDIGFDVVTEYISKGIVLENQGFIIQPYADLHFKIYKSDGPLSSVTADIGIWNSFHGHHSLKGAGHEQQAAALAAAGLPNPSSTPGWYEFDFSAGLTATFGNFSVGPHLRVYESPSDVFANIYTLGLDVSYDDHDLLGAFALHPRALVELNLIHSAGNGSRPNGSGANGQYYEVGIAPGHTWGDVTFTLPITVGFGSGDFYEGNRGFGFFSIGGDLAYALSFIPKCLGEWSIHGGAAYYRLGEGAARFVPAQSGYDPAIGFFNTRGDRNQFVFTGGMKVAF